MDSETRKSVRRRRDGNTVSVVHEQLRAMIIEMQLRPGERLNEMQLTDLLGVGRTPLREAINRLLVEQLVEFKPNRGFFIRQVDVKEIEDIFEMREIVEVAIVKLVPKRASDFDIKSLNDHCEMVLRDHPGSEPGDLVHEDAMFHERLAALSGNASLLRWMRGANSRIHFVRLAPRGEERKRSFEEHAKIARAISTRDADAAAELMSNHVTQRAGGLRRAIADGLLIGLSRPANGDVYLSGIEGGRNQ